MFVSALLILFASVPVTGETAPGYEKLDAVMTSQMEKIGATAASLTLAKDGEVLVSRGYGWADRGQRRAVRPETTFRLASVSKPITAAVVTELIRARALKEDTLAFRYLKLEPWNRKLGDPRLEEITVKHLLEHRGGWDRDATYDPMYRLDEIRQKLKVRRNDFVPAHVVTYMLAEPLQFAPGKGKAYSNFGYCVLGRVIEKATKSTYEKAVAKFVSKRIGKTDIRMSATEPKRRHPSEVYYPAESGLVIELRDALGGLTSSTPTLCAFLKEFWITGERRKATRGRSLTQTGSHTKSTTAIISQRSNGYDYAILFNARRKGHYKQDTKDLRKVINEFLEKK